MDPSLNSRAKAKQTIKNVPSKLDQAAQMQQDIPTTKGEVSHAEDFFMQKEKKDDTFYADLIKDLSFSEDEDINTVEPYVQPITLKKPNRQKITPSTESMHAKKDIFTISKVLKNTGFSSTINSSNKRFLGKKRKYGGLMSKILLSLSDDVIRLERNQKQIEVGLARVNRKVDWLCQNVRPRKVHEDEQISFKLSKNSGRDFSLPYKTIGIACSKNEHTYKVEIQLDCLLSPSIMIKQCFDELKGNETNPIKCKLYPDSCKFTLKDRQITRSHTCILRQDYHIKTSPLKLPMIEEHKNGLYKLFGPKVSQCTYKEDLLFQVYWFHSTIKDVQDDFETAERNLLGNIAYRKLEHLEVNFVEVTGCGYRPDYNFALLQAALFSIQLLNPNICYLFRDELDYDMYSEMGYTKFSSKKLDILGYDYVLLSPTFKAGDKLKWI